MRARAGAAQGGRPIEGSERAAKQRAPVGGGGGAPGGATPSPHPPKITPPPRPIVADTGQPTVDGWRGEAEVGEGRQKRGAPFG